VPPTAAVTPRALPSDPGSEAGPPPTSPSLGLTVAAVMVVSLVLGGLTSFAQTFLPDAVRPFANSASGWTLLVALVVARSRPSLALGAVLGALSFVALLLGYSAVSTLRGFPTSEELFLVAAVVVGPFVGAAAGALRMSGARAAIAVALLAGIAIGEAAYGLLVVSATTGWFTWSLIGLIGIALLVGTSVQRLHSLRLRCLAVGLTAAVGLAFFLTYTAVGSIGL
jgi:hypothetical protein